MEICKRDGCEKPVHVKLRQLCHTHYHYWAMHNLKSRECGLEGCTERHYSKDRCRRHYNALQPKKPRERKPVFAGPCAECGKPEPSGKYAKRMCRSCYARDWYQRNLEARRAYWHKYNAKDMTDRPFAPVKDHVKYFQAHRRVKRLRGLPENFPCVVCGTPAQEWALIPGMGEHTETIRGYVLAYSLNPDAYQPMCVRDHRRLDNPRCSG